VGPGAFWLRNPALAEQADAWRLLMERGTALPRRLSELAILVANRHFSATYAWCRHAAVASRAGLDRAMVEALAEHLPPTFSDPMEAIVYRVSRELLATTGLSEGHCQLNEKIARLCSKERTIYGFVLSRTPVFSSLTHPQISSRGRRLVAIFNKLTMPPGASTGLAHVATRWPSR
jgi:alkylhydroperoxidase family enzyme